MAFALPLIGLTALTGFFLNKDEASVTSRKSVIARNDVVPNDMPSGPNIYSSNMANEADYQTLQKGLKMYEDSKDPSITGVLPPIFNTYSMNGNTDVLNYSKQPIVTPINSKQMNEINEMNKRSNVLSRSGTGGDGMPISQRPMFNPVYATYENNNSKSTELPNSDFSALTVPSGGNTNPLTGLPYETEHKNMVPFFGGSVKQNVEKLTNTTTLDLFTGNHDTFIHKKEVKPFYTLMKQDINGTPIITENIDQDRYIQSNYKQNEKPFYEERVAAPIAGTIDNNIRVYGTPVDQLRVASKPKLTFEGRTLSGQMASVRGVQPEVKKNLVNRYYDNTPDMWLKTTGAVKADAARDNYTFKPTSRQDTSNQSYYGAGHASSQVKTSQRLVNEGFNNTQPGSGTGEIQGSAVQPSIKTTYKTDYTRNFNTSKRKDIEYDYGKSTYTPYDTERHITGETNQFDLNVHRQNMATKVYQQDDVKPTVKQTTLSYDNSGNIKSSFDNGKMTAVDTGIQHWDAKATNKQTLINNKYIGGLKKDEGMGYTVATYAAKTTGKEVITANSNYTGNSSAGDSTRQPQVYSTYFDPIKTRNVTSVHYTGSGAPTTRIDTSSRTNYNNAEINDRQETLLVNERPSGPQKFQISSGVDSQGTYKYTQKMELKEESSYRKMQDINEFINPLLPHLTTPQQNIGFVENRKETQSEEENNRLEPMLIINQLKGNPFIIDGPNRI